MNLDHDLIELAQTLLRQDRRQEAHTCLAAALKINPRLLAAHNLIEQQGLPGNFTTAFGVNALISDNDDIFRFFANHPTSTNPIRDYLADGWRTMNELNLVLDRLGQPLRHCKRFLEFASGFGRFSRHLVKQLPAGTLHVSDIVPGSVDFLKQTFHVGGFYSTLSPQDLQVTERFEVIFVLSLFSHLPESTWTPWLQKLYSMLEPGGSLIITTHGEKAAKHLGAELPGSGFAFVASSESTALAGEDYGVTFTSADYVRRAAAQVNPKAALIEFPGHFWDMQDGYVLKA